MTTKTDDEIDEQQQPDEADAEQEHQTEGHGHRFIDISIDVATSPLTVALSLGAITVLGVIEWPVAAVGAGAYLLGRQLKRN